MNLDFDPNKSLLNRPGLEAAIKKQENQDQDHQLKNSLFIPYEEYGDQDNFSHKANRNMKVATKVIVILVISFIFYAIFRFATSLF